MAVVKMFERQKIQEYNQSELLRGKTRVRKNRCRMLKVKIESEC